jgi:hypothetical protein
MIPNVLSTLALFGLALLSALQAVTELPIP